ncbi:Sec-independent protein translocase protein TatB [Ancylobacter sp. Lp-2]|uniref:Sec-independent protein translocase protein TatB n=1 Tax=Ancylobacter sp. Lp-2 TaxID=2881339 RepID=UPI001E56E568|nr:Sec-independent protein translocase protein TatB [Ancylobacter sp. Lp-2]MCB4770065.1 Sec-independent protein translocase protein TatB [Ancylobacter sp. Lp-2]
MFDIGWSEMLVIGVVALVVIGPKELPGVIRNVGRMVGKLRRMAGEFQGTFQEALREADLADVKKTLSGLADDTQNSLSSVRDSVAASIPTNPLHDIEQQLKDAATPVERKDLPAPADPTAPPPAAPEATELEPNAFESIETEVRSATEAIAEAAPAPVVAAGETVPPAAPSADKVVAVPEVSEPEISEAVADLDRPSVAPEAKPVTVAPNAETEVAEAVADLDHPPATADSKISETKISETKTAASAPPAGEDASKAKGA